MKVSVVIPAFNAASCLPRAVRSIRPRGMDGTEIIVVDDASTDDTRSVADRLAREIANMRVIRRTLNEGAGRARNVGLREARGKYVCFLDADDAYSETVFAETAPLLDALPGFHAVSFHIRLVNCHRAVLPGYLRAIERESAANVLIRTEFARLLGGFPTSPEFHTAYGGQDVAFRVALNTWGLVYRLDSEAALLHTVRRHSHFDKHLDDFEAGRRLDPATYDVLSKAFEDRAEWVRRRMAQWRRRTALPAKGIERAV